MNTTDKRVRSDSTINLRVSQQTRDLIDDAAAMLGKSRTDFILDSARQQATDVLLDRQLFGLAAAQHDAFMRVLANPPPPNKALKELLSRKLPWEA